MDNHWETFGGAFNTALFQCVGNLSRSHLALDDLKAELRGFRNAAAQERANGYLAATSGKGCGQRGAHGSISRLAQGSRRLSSPKRRNRSVERCLLGL